MRARERVLLREGTNARSLLSMQFGPQSDGNAD